MGLDLKEIKMENGNLPIQTWRNFPIQQQPLWPCPIELSSAVQTIRSLPPLISPMEVHKLRKELRRIAEEGVGFVVQGGDCAERFADCRPEAIESKVKLLLQMGGIVKHGTGEHCTIIARIAGQYGKPRSSNPLTEDPKKIFRGDNIHSFENINERRPNPQRLVLGYFHSSATLNYIKTLLRDGFVDIPDFPPSWDTSFLKKCDQNESNVPISALSKASENAYVHRVARHLEDEKIEVHVSHEAILLDYEDAMTREVDGKFYNLSAPFIWIGDRTRQLDHAHLEYVRHIENPIGIKVGPSMEPEELIMLLKLVLEDPDKSPGRVTLITRYGVSKISQCLPRHIEAVKTAGYKVVWSCDPCHGNTQVSQENGLKFRDFNHIFEEVKQCFEIHRAYGSRLGGVHIEATGEDVTECTGGLDLLTETDLPKKFESYCDPRLNYNQSMEFALRLSHLLRSSNSDESSQNKSYANPPEVME